MSPSYRTCRQVSKPCAGWVCTFSKPPFIEKPYYREGAGRARQARQEEAGAEDEARQEERYAAKPKSGKQSAKAVKRGTGPG